MNIRNQVVGFPFSLTSGQGLGASHSSLHSFLPTRSLGQADIKCDFNMATGNVCVEDRLLSFADVGGNIEFSYFYNSLAGI
jgi:hypothetical protein